MASLEFMAACPRGRRSVQEFSLNEDFDVPGARHLAIDARRASAAGSGQLPFTIYPGCDGAESRIRVRSVRSCKRQTDEAA